MRASKIANCSAVWWFRTLLQSLRRALLLCCVSAGCLQAFPQAPTTGDLQTITGTVVNQLTREPIARALVFSTDNRLAALTDDEGHFSFSVPRQEQSGQPDHIVFFGPPNLIQFGTTALSARKPGFLQDPEGSRTPATSLVISLMPEAIIHGRVLSGTAEPAANMTVQLFKRGVQEGSLHWIPSTSTQTNSTGEYRFADLPPGEYRVMTQELLDTDPETSPPGSQVYGFPPACFPGIPDFASGTTITLSMGQRFHADIRLARQAYYPVAIPVLNTDSPGLNVTVSAQAHPGPGYSLGYNAGTHRIEGLLPNGTYEVQAFGFGPEPASGQVTFTISGREVNSPSMAVAPSGVIPIEVHEEFTQEWNGQSTWSNGKHTFELHGPRIYLQMWLEPVDDFSQLGRPFLRPPLSRPDEPLVLENVLPGAYWVRFHTSRGYVQSVSSNGTDLLHHPLVVTSGSPASIEVDMRDDTAQVSGTISGVKTAGASANQPFYGTTAHVYFIPLPDSAGAFQDSFAMPDGAFFSTLPPGTYRVLAFARPRSNLPYRDATAMRAYADQGQVVTLVPGQTERLQLQLSSGD